MEEDGGSNEKRAGRREPEQARKGRKDKRHTDTDRSWWSCRFWPPEISGGMGVGYAEQGVGATRREEWKSDCETADGVPQEFQDSRRAGGHLRANGARGESGSSYAAEGRFMAKLRNPVVLGTYSMSFVSCGAKEPGGSGRRAEEPRQGKQDGIITNVHNIHFGTARARTV
ncbi:hypothetical protein DFH09DRAFT_1085825 [Mycena vulgaris]|nr:hypothetical protein DFH09DRAFT_1085825 [Mycena vulgaris]